MDQIGDKQYIAEREGSEWVVRLTEIVKHKRATFIARTSDQYSAEKIAKTLNEAEGL